MPTTSHLEKVAPFANHFSGFNKALKVIQPHLEAFKNFFESQVEAFEYEIQTLVRYALLNKGKRMRPILLFLSSLQNKALKGDVSEALLKAASVVELIHLATLVHDDILDGATLRHNTRTVKEAFGATEAVLLGDALFSHALFLASEFPTTQVCYEVAKSTQKACAGEIKQSLSKAYTEVSLNDYFRIIDLKTAELFAVSCYLGALLAGETLQYAQAVRAFGRHLGIAYQIFDDLNDIIGDEKHIGKTLGTDFLNGKHTLPLILLFQKLNEEQRKNWIENTSKKLFSLSDLKTHLSEYAIYQEVLTVFNKEISLAHSMLEPFMEKKSAICLMDLSNAISHSTHSLKW